MSKSVLQRAEELVCGERQDDYGHPYDDFTRTAKMASGLGFRIEGASGTVRDIAAKDVPLFMILVKLSRESHNHKEDNLTDCVGYIKTLEMVIQREEEICKKRNTQNGLKHGQICTKTDSTAIESAKKQGTTIE